jgi:phosphopantetheine--protein transferase-like protein
MFSSPFPDFISFFCEHLSSSHDFLLNPEEEVISASFGSSKRSAEFSFGRYCAHRALSKFEMESVPILRIAETREPCWPESVRGSITHSEGFAAAAVGLAKDVSGIGIDLESLSRVVDFNIRRHVCVDKEREFLESLPTEQANRYLRIIFSAKESIFKCFFPISQTYLYFQDAEIIIDENNSEFSFSLLKACTGITSAGFQHSGRFSIKDDLLLTSIYI